MDPYTDSGPLPFELPLNIPPDKGRNVLVRPFCRHRGSLIYVNNCPGNGEQPVVVCKHRSSSFCKMESQLNGYFHDNFGSWFSRRRPSIHLPEAFLPTLGFRRRNSPGSTSTSIKRLHEVRMAKRNSYVIVSAILKTSHKSDWFEKAHEQISRSKQLQQGKPRTNVAEPPFSTESNISVAIFSAKPRTSELNSTCKHKNKHIYMLINTRGMQLAENEGLIVLSGWGYGRIQILPPVSIFL